MRDLLKEVKIQPDYEKYSGQIENLIFDLDSLPPIEYQKTRPDLAKKGRVAEKKLIEIGFLDNDGDFYTDSRYRKNQEWKRAYKWWSENNT